jgi:hypothetical protein
MICISYGFSSSILFRSHQVCVGFCIYRWCCFRDEVDFQRVSDDGSNLPSTLPADGARCDMRCLGEWVVCALCCRCSCCRGAERNRMAERHPHLFEDVAAAKTLESAAKVNSSGSTEMTALAHGSKGGSAIVDAGGRSIGANGDVLYRIDEFGIDDDAIGIEGGPEMSQSQQQLPAWRRFLKSASTSSTSSSSTHDQSTAEAAALARGQNEYRRASLGTSLESQDEFAAGGDGGVATVGFQNDDDDDTGAYEEDEDANENGDGEAALRRQDEADSADAE